MQIMAEALGLALPGSALMPATSPDLLAFAREAGRQSVRLATMENMRPSDIVTMETVKSITCDFNAKFVCNCRQMQ